MGGLVLVRVGIGHDTHKLSEGRPLLLGGLRIDHPRGLVGHSDADVVCHAVADALLGAAGMGDIGEHYPTPIPSGADWIAPGCWPKLLNESSRPGGCRQIATSSSTHRNRS